MFNLALLGCSSYESHRETSLPDVFPDNTCSNFRVPVDAGSRQTFLTKSGVSRRRTALWGRLARAASGWYQVKTRETDPCVSLD